MTLLGVCALAAAMIAVPCASAAPTLHGVPAQDSLLFALDAGSGTLAPTGKGHFTLTLKGVDRRTTWFSDRPQRDAGRVATKGLFSAWRGLGFRKSPPNAALVIDHGRADRDTVAFELKLRSYQPRRHRVRFAARALGSLGNGLSHLNRRLDGRGPRRFGAASLFVDNTSSAADCTLGQPQLYASTSPNVTDMLPADGSLMLLDQNTALFSIYGTRFGGDGKTRFALPTMAAPPGMRWFVCAAGIYPSQGSLGEGCSPGEVDSWVLPGDWGGAVEDPNWLPADGRTVTTRAYPAYGLAFAGAAPSYQLPAVPAPPGMTSLICMGGGATLAPSLGEVDLYPGPPTVESAWWLPLDGRQLLIATNEELYAVLGNAFGPGDPATFALPTLPSPTEGLGYYLAVAGYWPFS
jgi:microcystin-dependent protein